MTKAVLSKPALKPEQAPIPAPDGAASQSAPANATRPGDSRVLHTALLGNLVVPGNVAGAPPMRLCLDEPRQMISSFSYTEMDELIALIQRERAGKLDEARRKLKAEFEAKAASIGLTSDQIFSRSHSAQERPKRGKKAEQKPAPAALKFRSTSGQTWSGRGGKPLWLNQAEAVGQMAEEFRVKG